MNRRYTFWSGLLGGFFLALSYFGTDQSQVQRYLSGASLRESRLGLMFNAVFKIPMQFFILLLGALVFVFYQFEPPPVFFNEAVWEAGLRRDTGARLHAFEQRYSEAHARKRHLIDRWLDARHAGDVAGGALGPRPGPRGAPRERGGPRRGEDGAASRPTRGRRPTTPTTSSSPSSCGTCRTG